MREDLRGFPLERKMGVEVVLGTVGREGMLPGEGGVGIEVIGGE